jgi:tetratricopeptide (TPR) repeat protein/tRNA A-37 threonylcarbamoyl transferase component Bud32
MAASSPNPGQILGHFRLIEAIGAGGMGIVYRARDERLERDVAVKVLNAKTLGDPTARARFRREALILSRLNHPNVEAVYDFYSEQGLDYLVLEYVPGASLDDRLHQGPLPEKEVVSLGVQLARGLAAAHARGVLHRDLKPGNLRVTPEHVLKILDFGLAQLFEALDEKRLTEAETVTVEALSFAGTPPYMAPEQLEQKEPDVRTDIYSAGVVLYEMATGSRPFPQQGLMLWEAILHSLPPAPRSVNKDISPELEAIILKCLEKDPNVRYQSAGELLGDLAELEVPSSGSWQRVVARRSIGRAKILLIAGIVLTVIAAAGLTWWKVTHPPIPDKKHIAVLPFRLTGAEPEDAALFQGLTDTVTNRLMQLTAAQPVEIIPAGEMAAHHITNMEEAQKQLGANLALDGSVQRNGDQVQVNLTFAEINSHKPLRADSVTGTSDDFKELEDKVVAASMRMLELELHAGSPPDESHATTSRDAYTAFTRGRGYLAHPFNPEDSDSAISQFQRALELDPGYAAAYASLGSAYWGKYEQTKDQKWISKMRDACQNALKLSPSSAGANICLGMIDEGTGHYEQAASDFQLALDADPTNDYAYRGLASAYERLGRMKLAEQTYKKAIQAHPENPSSYAWLGGLYAQEAHYGDAAEQFEKALQVGPDNPAFWSSLGGTYLVAGIYSKAEYSLQKAISLQPSYEAYTNLGDTYFLERKFPEAIGAFEEAVALGDRQIQAHGNLARAYYWYSPEHGKAKAELKKAIQLAESDLSVNPNDADVHTLGAEYFAMLGDRSQALEHLRVAQSQRPGDAETAYYAAKVYNLIGDREQALNWLEKAVKLGYSAAEINNAVELDSLRSDPRFKALDSKLHS